MIARLALATLAATLIAGSAFALVPATDVVAIQPQKNETIIEMNDLWPMTGPLAVEECATATCEDA